MRKLIAANYLLKLAVEKAQNGDLEKALNFSNNAFRDLPQLNTAQKLVCQGITKVYRDACNENKSHPYLTFLKGELVPITRVYTICPNCGVAAPKDLNSIISGGMILSDHVFCERCLKEDNENGK